MVRALALFLCLVVGPATALPHRVVSFNIRYGSANDGPDRWEQRLDKVVKTIETLDADVLGLQEAEAFQVREILEAVPRYAAVGVHRDDGLLKGEGAPLLYDRLRYTLDQSGTFWLSGTPDVVASNTWGAACNRTCTWARLVDLESGDAFYVYNTHFDHRSQKARLGSAGLIVERVAERKHSDPFVVMGDLNAAEDNPVIGVLLDGHGSPGEETGWDMVDTYRELYSQGTETADEKGGTFTGFRTDSDGGTKKIDYVLRGPGLKVLDAGIDRRKIEGRYPSDHFPVWAVIRIICDES